MFKNRYTSERGRGQDREWGRGMARGRGRATRGRGTGMARQGPLGVNTRQGPYNIAKSFSRAKDMIQRHDLFDDSMKAAGLTGVETGTKLYISNLDFGVSNEDIKELFSEIGVLRRSSVHYDRNGRPNGSAEVVFNRRSDALAALKRYNNVQLDGKPMNIEVIGTNLGLPVTPRINVVGGGGRGTRTVVMTPEFSQGVARSGTKSFRRGSGSGRGNFQRWTGRGRGQGPARGRGGRGHGRKQRVQKSADELDKELEKYHAEPMNTS